MESSITLKINEPAAEFVNRNKNMIKVVNRPPGVNFYMASWDQKDPGFVTFTHGSNTLSIKNVLGATGADAPSSSQEGLVQFKVYAGLTQPDLIGHDEARKLFISQLRGIRKAGWRIFINEGDPRLRGKAMLDFILAESSASSMDADYEPTFAEWMNIPSNTLWQFHINHVYLTVSFTREPTLLDPEKPGSYLISYTIESENEHYRNYVTPKQRAQWKSALPSQLEYLPTMRDEKEAELRARGVQIDDTYQDQPVPDFSR